MLNIMFFLLLTGLAFAMVIYFWRQEDRVSEEEYEDFVVKKNKLATVNNSEIKIGSSRSTKSMPVKNLHALDIYPIGDLDQNTFEKTYKSSNRNYSKHDDYYAPKFYKLSKESEYKEEKRKHKYTKDLEMYPIYEDANNNKDLHKLDGNFIWEVNEKKVA